MPELNPCEFFLLRYVPDLVKDEFINIGVVLSDPRGHAEMRFARDWSRVRCLDPQADIEMLEAVHAEMRNALRENTSREQLLNRIQDSFSNSIQLSPVKACLAPSAQAEIENLEKLYLQTSKRGGMPRSPSARQRIFERMQDEFEKASVWKNMWHEIPVANYGHPGDPLKIDCGYRPNGIVKMFHALALSADVNPAKALAFSYPQMQKGILEKEKLKAELTAIVDIQPGEEDAAFAVSALRQSRINVAHLSEMSGIAERVRRDMGL